MRHAIIALLAGLLLAAPVHSQEGADIIQEGGAIIPPPGFVLEDPLAAPAEPQEPQVLLLRR